MFDDFDEFVEYHQISYEELGPTSTGPTSPGPTSTGQLALPTPGCQTDGSWTIKDCGWEREVPKLWEADKAINRRLRREQGMSDEAVWNPETVELAREFHDDYERQAKRLGWSSQTPVPFEELPEANLQTMLCTVARISAMVINECRDLTAEEPKCEHDTGHWERDAGNKKLHWVTYAHCPLCGEKLEG